MFDAKLKKCKKLYRFEYGMVCGFAASSIEARIETL
jgi:hypothetical protein